MNDDLFRAAIRYAYAKGRRDVAAATLGATQPAATIRSDWLAAYLDREQGPGMHWRHRQIRDIPPDALATDDCYEKWPVVEGVRVSEEEFYGMRALVDGALERRE